MGHPGHHQQSPPRVKRYLGNPERKTYGLLQRENVIPIEISTEPYNSNYGKCYETRIVANCLGKWKHYRYPPDNIVGNENEPVNNTFF